MKQVHQGCLCSVLNIRTLREMETVKLTKKETHLLMILYIKHTILSIENSAKKLHLVSKSQFRRQMHMALEKLNSYS